VQQQPSGKVAIQSWGLSILGHMKFVRRLGQFPIGCVYAYRPRQEFMMCFILLSRRSLKLFLLALFPHCRQLSEAEQCPNLTRWNVPDQQRILGRYWFSGRARLQMKPLGNCWSNSRKIIQISRSRTSCFARGKCYRHVLW
jgi:hypothetical protein